MLGGAGTFYFALVIWSTNWSTCFISNVSTSSGDSETPTPVWRKDASHALRSGNDTNMSRRILCEHMLGSSCAELYLRFFEERV